MNVWIYGIYDNMASIIKHKLCIIIFFVVVKKSLLTKNFLQIAVIHFTIWVPLYTCHFNSVKFWQNVNLSPWTEGGNPSFRDTIFWLCQYWGMDRVTWNLKSWEVLILLNRFPEQLQSFPYSSSKLGSKWL